MSQPINVRALDPEDATRYTAFRLRALEQDPAAFASNPDELRAASRAVVERQLARDDGSTVFSVAQGEALIASHTRGTCGAGTSRLNIEAEDWESCCCTRH
jgi:hypothetical protein